MNLMQGNKHFTLDPKHSCLIRGASGAAVYDFAGGMVIAVPPSSLAYIDSASGLFALNARTPPEVHLFVQSLAARGIGTYGAPRAETQSMSDTVHAVKPDFAWLELTQSCNLRCGHCYGSFGPRPAATERLSDDDWAATLAQVKEYGFERVQFIGGEPLTHPALPGLLFEAARHSFLFVEVFSNLLLLDDRLLNALATNGTHLATTVYSVESAVHDRVTCSVGSFKKTVNAIKRAREWGIPVRVNCIVSSMNEGRVGNLERFSETLGATYGGQDEVRPTGRGTATTCRTTVARRMVRPPFRTDRRSFEEARHYNPCWKGKIAITDDGSVLPCVFSRDHVAGNIREKPLAEIINSQEMQDYWGLSKDTIEVCRDCEFRYACTDCRPLALGWNGRRLSAKTHGCNYDPYSGKWE